MQGDDLRIKETTFRVRFAETDMMGMVHHASYVVYLEVGRVDFSRQAGAAYADLEAQGYSLAVCEANLRYVNPARFDQLITVRTWVSEIRSRTVAFGYEIVDGQTQQVLVTANTKLICIDREGKVRRIPESWFNVMHRTALNQ
jgi:acyl-CoA thioester hydrolase